MTGPRLGDVQLELEPEEPIELEPIELEPESPATPTTTVALMEVLPADFPLPALIRFIPNPVLRLQAADAARYAMTLEVKGADGLERADVALTTLRACQKAIEEHFADPVDIANKLHKGLTSVRSEWLSAGKASIDAVGGKVYAEKRRLDAIAAEERRQAQEEADRIAREAARRQTEEARKAQAPAAVVEELQRQADTAKAPPVPAAATTAPAAMRGTSIVENWKATVAGTPRDAELNPDTDALTPAQRLQVFELLKAILDGRAPLTAVSLNWSYLNKRAKSDKTVLQIPGIESFDAGGVRAKSTRAK